MTASTRDLQFTLHEVLDYAGHYQRLHGNDAPTRELIDAIIEEASRFCEGELAPLNRSGDEEGCTFVDGAVTAPAGFKAAYEKYVEGGWAGLCGETEHGGQGLPDSLGLVLEHLMAAANPAWTMYPALSRGVVEALEHHGSPEQKAQFLPKLLSGEWTGTMCLTEPHAGSDVGSASSGATRNDDGTYNLSEEQAAMVRAVCASPRFVLPVEGRPGAGKTYATEAIDSGAAADKLAAISLSALL